MPAIHSASSYSDGSGLLEFVRIGVQSRTRWSKSGPIMRLLGRLPCPVTSWIRPSESRNARTGMSGQSKSAQRIVS